MSANELDDLILKAVEEADKMKIDMNKKKASENEENSWSEYEATFKAMIYHQLIENGLDYRKISMENSPDVKNDDDLESKKVDIWINEANDVYLMEVKMIGVHSKTKGLRKVNNKDGLYGDLLKLTEIVKYYKDKHNFGIAIAVYDGHDDNIDCEYLESRLNKDLTDLLSNYIKMMICANGKCKYVKN